MPKEQINYPVADEDGYVPGSLEVYWGKVSGDHVQIGMTVSGEHIRERATDTEVSAYGFFTGSLSDEEIDKLIKALQRAKRARKGDQ